MSAQLAVDVQIVSSAASVPAEAEIATLLQQVVGSEVASGDLELAVRIVDEQEARELNSRFRQIDKATNVLSFSADVIGLADGTRRPLGDIVICAPIVEREATEQGKNVASHWTHMLVHGALHLLGYDHQADPDATTMETLEKEILAAHGIDDPYAARHE